MNCIYTLTCFCSDTNDILNKFLCLVCTWFQYLLYKSKRYNRLNLNFHPIQNLLTFASGYLVKFCNFYSQLRLETVFPVLKPTQICCININISFPKNCNLFTNWLPSFTQIPSLKEYPHNLTKYGSKQKEV